MFLYTQKPQMSFQEQFKQQISQVPEYAYDDVFYALEWAKQILTNYEGSGHCLQLTAKDDKICCSFAKPSWNSDYTGTYEYDACEAIINAVCKYLAGG